MRRIELNMTYWLCRPNPSQKTVNRHFFGSNDSLQKLIPSKKTTFRTQFRTLDESSYMLTQTGILRFPDTSESVCQCIAVRLVGLPGFRSHTGSNTLFWVRIARGEPQYL